MKVAILVGSRSDYEVAKETAQILDEFKVSHALEITSAHRSPERTLKLVRAFEEKGAEVFIAVAGKAAHLAGFVAAHTIRPVIGVPVKDSAVGGLDALLSTAQMPRGVPVATMGLGKSGASNAALLAVKILALENESLKKKIMGYKKKLASQVEDDSKKIREKK